MAATAGVLLTDAQERSAAATCRSLRAAGFRVGAASSSARPAPGQWSLRCTGRYAVASPRSDERSFAEDVAAIAGEDGYFAVLPGADASLLAISRHRDAFTGVELGLPPAETVEACVSKIGLLEAADRAGLESPKSIVCDSVEAVRSAVDELGLPALLKPRSTVFEHEGRTGEQSSLLVEDIDMLEQRLPAFGFPCLLQRREAGATMSFGGVFGGGRMLGAVFSRYLRVWPARAGSASFSETVDVPGPLVERIEGFLTGIGWEGIFELELIERSGGRYGAIDFNPRLYGSLSLAERAGVPLPAIWCEWLARGRAEVRTAKAGYRYRWEDAELRNFLRLIQERRLRAAASVARPRRRCAHAYFRWNDPGPLVGRALEMRRRLGEKRHSATRERMAARQEL